MTLRGGSLGNRRKARPKRRKKNRCGKRKFSRHQSLKEWDFLKEDDGEEKIEVGMLMRRRLWRERTAAKPQKI